MSIEEFASGPADSNLLSDQEKLELYKWYGVRTGHVLTTFSSVTRKRPLLSCTRFDLSSFEGIWPNAPDRKWFFNFSVNAHVRFHGVGVLGCKGEKNTLKVTVSLLNITSGDTVAMKRTKVTVEADEGIYKVLFDRAVLIAPGTQYKVTAVSIGPRSPRAMNGLREVTCDHGNRSATFTFTDTPHRGRDEYDVSLMGHIPTIYFSFNE